MHELNFLLHSIPFLVQIPIRPMSEYNEAAELTPANIPKPEGDIDVSQIINIGKEIFQIVKDNAPVYAFHNIYFFTSQIIIYLNLNASEKKKKQASHHHKNFAPFFLIIFFPPLIYLFVQSLVLSPFP